MSAEASHGLPVSRSGRPRRSVVETIGHRGAPREARENTLASFDRALALGVDGIELDVHCSADGVVFAHHDPIIPADAPAAVAGRAIADLPSSTLIDAYRGLDEAPPRLDDALDLIGDRALAYVEIKGANIERAVVDVIAASRAACAVHAFDHRAVRRVRELAPAMRTGILLEARLVDPEAALATAAASDYWQRWTMIDCDLVTAVHRAGGRVIAWTVNDVADAEALVAMGVDAICTDLPGVMRRAGGAGH